MEKEIEKREWIKYAIGLKFDRMDSGWYVGFACYWFCVMFHRNLGQEAFYNPNTRRWTGLMFFYNLNQPLHEGELIWARCIKWGWYAA